ncbi:MAG: DUF4363 family protein [Clostridiales bacterium]|jgi:hypothetical protein|nr:DUF4363 family protein [Clostridiales bacterium]
MKRELVAVSLILIIFALSLVNIRYVESRTDMLTNDVEAAEKLFINGDADAAISLVKESLDNWLSWEPYTHIMLRHSEVDLVTDAYYELLSKLQSEEEVPEAAYRRLKEQLRSISAMERITIGSIL